MYRFTEAYLNGIEAPQWSSTCDFSQADKEIHDAVSAILAKHSVILDGQTITGSNNPSSRLQFAMLSSQFILNCKFQGDFTSHDFSGFIIEDCKFLEDTLLPNNGSFLASLKEKKLKGCIFDGPVDFSMYNFQDFRLSNLQFHKDCKFPDNPELFQIIYCSIVENTVLPALDFRKYNLDEVEFRDVVFPFGTIFPDDKDFFVNLSSSSINGCTFPAFDYSGYDFRGVSFNYCTFDEHAILPQYPNFLSSTKKYNGNPYIREVKFPVADYSNYDFDNIHFSDCEFPEGCKIPINIFEDSRHVYDCTFPKDFIMERLCMPDPFPANVKICLNEMDFTHDELVLLHAKCSKRKNVFLPMLSDVAI